MSDLPAHSKNGLAHTVSALNNHDILSEIFSQLGAQLASASTEPRMARRHLGWAALTCKSFLDPCLDALWRSMDSLMPLLRLLPIIWPFDNEYTITGKIDDKHWDRLDYYARRVRNFYHVETDIPPSIYLHLAQLRASPLFPNLRRLQCPSLSSDAPHLFLFLTPSLEQIEFLSTSPGGDKIASFLSAARGEIPGLKHLILRGQVLDLTFGIVPHFANLRSLELVVSGSLPQETYLMQVGALERLETLALHLPSEVVHTLDFPDKEGGFVSLKDLRIQGSFNSTAKFIRGMRPAHLEFITLMFTRAAGSRASEESKTQHRDLVRECLRIVCTRASLSLREITIVDEGTPRLDLSGVDLRPLLELRNLEKLRIGCWRQLVCSEGFVRELGAAWAGTLSSLELPLDLGALTFPDLHFLAETCPHLKHLQSVIYVDDFSPALPVDCEHDHGLETLSVGSGNITNTPLMIRHLLHCFPRLKDVHVHPGLYPDQWQQIRSCVQMCRVMKLDDMLQ